MERTSKAVQSTTLNAKHKYLCEPVSPKWTQEVGTSMHFMPVSMACVTRIIREATGGR